MHKLLNIQLKKVYGKDFEIKDEKLIKFIKLVEDAYTNYEEEEKFLENILAVNAKELESSNDLLYRKQELLKSVENSMDDTIFYKDLKHSYIGCNTKFMKFLGLSEQELIGKHDSDFFDTETTKKYYEINENIIKNKTKIVYKQWVDFQGEKIYVLTSKTPLISKSGEVIGIVGVSRDITNEYKLQKDIEYKNIMLIQQNKLVSMGEMIANIAHQWRQPLNSLSLLIQKLGIFYKQGLLNNDKVDEYISESMFLMQEMSQTIDDFRNFFSPDRVLEDFSIDESIHKSSIIIKSILEENDIELTVNVKNKYFVNGYKNEFFQVMLNILNNATEALIINKIDNPKIDITIREKDDNVIIKICDNARGIDNSVITKIFNPYFTTKDTGTGLGLYMSKIIIETHMHGKLKVETNRKGTVFTIILKGKQLN